MLDNKDIVDWCPLLDGQWMEFNLQAFDILFCNE